MGAIMKLIIGTAVVAAIVVGGSVAYSLTSTNPRQATEYFPGHQHENGDTHGAPSHSGGTDAYGCHNGSVPYHCH